MPEVLFSVVQTWEVTATHPLLLVVGVLLIVVILLVLWFGATRPNPWTVKLNMKQQTIVNIRFRMTSTQGPAVSG